MATAKSPAGSLEPINPNKGKWTDNIGGQQIVELRALAEDINKTVDATVKHVAKGKIKVGKLLIEARAHFVNNDAGFGQWRVENTSVQSKQHAHYLMQVAERFGNAPKLIEGVNYSIMQELVLADQKDIEWIESKIDAGEPLPTVAEVRHKVKQSQADRIAEAVAKGTSKKGMPVKHGVTVIQNPNVSINTIVVEELHVRIKRVVDRGLKGIEGDLIICGLDPDPQCACNPDVLDAIEQYYQGRANEESFKILARSLERVRKDFEDFSR